jgi:hypothetical protein
MDYLRELLGSERAQVPESLRDTRRETVNVDEQDCAGQLLLGRVHRQVTALGEQPEV